MTNMPKRIKAWRHEIKGDDGFVDADGFWFVEDEPAIPEAEKYIRADICDNSFRNKVQYVVQVKELEAEVERLRDALRQVCNVVYNDNGDVTYDTQTMARVHKLARIALDKEDKQ